MPFQPLPFPLVRRQLRDGLTECVAIGHHTCTGKLRCSACHYRAALAPGRAGRQNQLAVVAF